MTDELDQRLKAVERLTALYRHVRAAPTRRAEVPPWAGILLSHHLCDLYGGRQ
jgi:hypothetical protein